MNSKVLTHKAYLYATEFFAGMSVMAVELGASRLLAPYFSSSQIVWTIIIGTIMIAMALGNLCGGRWADKDPSPDRLYRRITIAALWIALIPVVGKYIILGISALLIVAVNNHLLIWAAFLACMVIFVFPLFLLGTVTPSLAKYTMDNLEDNGRTVGTLGAYNTIGSILGTFLPTFVTIPAVGTSITFLIFAGILLLLAGIYFIHRNTSGKDLSAESGNTSNAESENASNVMSGKDTNIESGNNALNIESGKDSNVESKNASSVDSGKVSKVASGKAKGSISMLFCLLIYVLCCIFGHNDSFAFWENNLTYEGESIYNYLQVREDEESVALSTNVLFGVQSILKKDGKLTGLYYDYALAAPLMAASPENAAKEILVLGMGTGTFASQCERYFEGVDVEGVEIDEKITGLAKKYFRMSENAKVTTYDGRAFLQANSKKYDVIMVDAYQDITIPFQMSTVEFFTLVKKHLNEGGILVVNMNMRGSKKGNIDEYLSDTIASVFPCVYTVDVEGTTNRELFAGDFDGLEQKQASDYGKTRVNDRNIASASSDSLLTQLEQKISELQDQELQRLMWRVKRRLEPYRAGKHVLTDDRAPVELLGMQVIDELIEGELKYYKELIHQKGWKAILE